MIDRDMTIPLFVPGRLCLFGEHSDWAGIHRLMNAEIVPGEAIVTGIEEGIRAEVARSDRFEITSSASCLAKIWTDFDAPMEGGFLKEVALSDSFFANAAGTASYMLEHYRVGGIRIHLTEMTLPIKKGLSSSAAICVLVVRAFNRLYDLNLSTSDEMEAAFRGEQRTRSRCGRLDQACAFGVRPVRMTFDGNDVGAEPLTVGAPFHFVFADLNAGKNTVKILADLSRAYPFPENESDRLLHRALGADNRRINAEAAEAIRLGDAPRLGALMTESQALFDEKIAPHSPEELRSPRLHAVLADPSVARLVYGGKGVGSHGDGSVQFLAKSKETQEKLIVLLQKMGLTPFRLTLAPTRRVRKAVIPAAGLASRLWPASRGVRKEFFPVIDRDGLAKPAILVLLEELLESGIEEICLVLGSEEDRRFYEQFFEPVPEEMRKKFSPAALREEERMAEIQKRLRYSYQPVPRGFGDAVFRSRDFTGGEPVLLLLCDTIYRSRIKIPCAAQLIAAYEKVEKTVAAVIPADPEAARRCGMVRGFWEDVEERLMRIEEIAEKPGTDYARNQMTLSSKTRGDACYAVFGEYILTPEIYAALESELAGTKEGEIDLTKALDTVRRGSGLYGFVPEGESFDLGTPDVYRESVNVFGREWTS